MDWVLGLTLGRPTSQPDFRCSFTECSQVLLQGGDEIRNELHWDDDPGTYRRTKHTLGLNFTYFLV